MPYIYPILIILCTYYLSRDEHIYTRTNKPFSQRTHFKYSSATRVVFFTLYLYSGLRPSVRGKIASDNENLRNLRCIKNICHVILALLTSESAYSITPVEPLKPRLWDNPNKHSKSAYPSKGLTDRQQL